MSDSMVSGLRSHYLPSMVALQLEMYQLSRLLKDAHHDLFRHLKRNVPTVVTLNSLRTQPERVLLQTERTMRRTWA